MKKRFRYLFASALFLSALSLFSVSPSSPEAPMPEPQEAQQPAKKDTTARYPVKKTQITSQEDLDKRSPIDLKDPSNVKTEVEYDLKNNIYLFKTKVGDDILVTPFSLSVDEYMDYSLKKSMAEYFRSKNEEAVEKKDNKEDFSLKDIKINLGPAEKIFGPGGVRIKTQGYTEISMGVKHNNTKSPSRAENRQSKLMFDFDQKIQLNVNASVGDKVNFGMNYDTESTFDFDSNKLKLAYEGKEDEIIKHLEAGNVSMSTTNSLINGGAALFGIKADLQFGKLRVSTVLSQQESQSQTVNSKGGVQTTPFELTADQYDGNRHFFFGHYFRDNYDQAMSKFPVINSNVKIEKLEVWVTNKRGNFDNARNIIALADLGERDSINNIAWHGSGLTKYPDNNANDMYGKLNLTYNKARDIKQANRTLEQITDFESGLDYEKLESARMLESSEYTFNPQLGYISLRSALQADEVLAIAYTYTVESKKYQVGELASNIVDKFDPNNPKSGALFVKLLKPVSMSPNSYSWDLMMKNVYNLGAYQIQQDKFRLDISYQSDTTGTYTNYIPEGKIKDKLLLRVMNLDRLDSRGNVVKNGATEGDGIFDFVEGVTIVSQNGRIIFPVIEPFGKHLAKEIGDTAIARRYVFQELYDMSIDNAKQIAEKNKFKISGQYRASSANELDLGATNVAKGSVRVTAGGITLQEGSQYTVDYISGKVIIIDQSIIDAGTAISVSLENQALFSMQRKTMMGLNLSYDFTKDFNIGATIMHMYEKPLTVKTQIGNESLKNTVWGLNTSYRTQSQWLTNMIDKLPFVNATQPSNISVNAEFAQMLPGHFENKYGGGYSYLDDFETAKSRISLTDFYSWKLASTPMDKKKGNDALFPEAVLSDSIDYGKNRALLAWYSIDRLFTLRSSSLTPQHIKNDKEQLSNHYVREVSMSEVYPNKQTLYNETSKLATFDLAFYPNERGPYNLDRNLNTDGSLKSPEERWGGIMRRINSPDFEANNVEYLEFWLMDPFAYDKTTPGNTGGEMYFNIGNVSEDILKDGHKFYENGLPLNNDTTAYAYTVWGKVPTRQSTTYSFNSDLSDADRRKQDVGLNGLSSAEELEFKAYKEYIDAIRNDGLDDKALQRVLNDPAADNYHYFRGTDYDRDEVSILDRYKYYNNTEGNSISTEKYSTVSNTNPDVEDINQDYTMSETEAYYQYKVELNPLKMEVGSNYITDKRELEVPLRNDTRGKITWYQFKIPLKDKTDPNREVIGNIQDFKNIRFMRMFLTKFRQPVVLRFGSLEFIRGEWRIYSHSLSQTGGAGTGTLNMSTVNFEENNDKVPVNYVLPPDVDRVLDPSQPQLRQENEQSLSLQVIDLQQNTARAVYKNTNYDLRRYKRLQLYTHAEEVLGKENLAKGDLAIFLRLGSDYKNNYYEYEIPLTITPPDHYGNSESQRLIVWPKENMLDFSLDLLKNLKLERNKEKRRGVPGVSYTEEFIGYDPENKNNKMTIVGNPSLSEVKVMMIGVRNKSNATKSAEVWVNELRLTDFDEEGGWAAQVNMNVALSDIGNVSVMGRKETAGFGSLDQSLMERRSDDFSMYTIATNLDLGRFVPEQAKLSIPFYYSYSNQTVSPKYDPLDQDVTLKESLALVETKHEKDSIRNLAEDKVISKNLSFSGVKLNIKSKTPMPYDPANFSLGYSFSETKTTNPTTVYDVVKDYRANLSYSYSPLMKSWAPFKNSESKSNASKFTKALSFNYLPNNISFNSQISRLYSETVIRDLESYSLGGNNDANNFTSWSQDFYWDRDLSISWDFTRNLKASFSSGTRAEIEEPYMAVNKDIVGKDRYQNWKDSVRNSILSLGRPLSYRQNAKLTYTLPFNTIPVLDWINSTANYESNYRWNRGAESEPGYELGNTINNDLTLGLNSRLNLVSLYNKSSFLKEVNQKFEQTRRSNQRPNAAKRPPAKKKKFETEIQLADSAVIATHNLNTKNIRITAKLNDRVYPIKFKKVDKNKIQILTEDSVKVALTIMEGPDPTEGTWYKMAQYAARGVMSVRSISINISSRNETFLPGFKPSVGDAFGQLNSDRGLSPGLGFAFGLQGGEDFIAKAKNKQWLLESDPTTTMNMSPAVHNSSSKVDIRAELEPIKGLKISLSGFREKNDRTDFQFMYTGEPKTFGGNFAITTIAFTTAFQGSKAKNDYASAVFDKFLDSREIVANRLTEMYKGTTYPVPGDPQYDPTMSPVNKNSPDVLIPAFLAAYTGRDPKKVSTSFFPALTSMLPNWNMTYEGLINMPWIKDKFKSLKLSHSYEAQYRVGAFNSHLDWIDAGKGGLGYITNPVDGKHTPSSAYDISSVSITEAFNPLFGAEGTLNNSMTVRAKYNKARTLNLNMSAYQIVEALRNEFIVGMGYKINDFNRVLGITSRSAKGFNNDLNININISYLSNNTLIRKIEERFTQATSGTTILSLKASADYSLSKSLTLKAYFDRIMNTPLLSSSAYPSTNTDFGISLRFTLSE